MKREKIAEFDWELVQGEPVTAVLGTSTPGSNQYEQVAIQIGSRAVVLSVDSEFDEVIAELWRADRLEGGWASVPQLARGVGRELGWSWSCENSQGYLDCLLVSFEGPAPQVAFVGEASSLSLYLLDREQGALTGFWNPPLA